MPQKSKSATTCFFYVGNGIAQGLFSGYRGFSLCPRNPPHAKLNARRIFHSLRPTSLHISIFMGTRHERLFVPNKYARFRRRCAPLRSSASPPLTSHGTSSCAPQSTAFPYRAARAESGIRSAPTRGSSARSAIWSRPRPGPPRSRRSGLPPRPSSPARRRAALTRRDGQGHSGIEPHGPWRGRQPRARRRLRRRVGGRT